MPNSTVVYPRILIKTSQTCAVVVIVEFVLAMLVLGSAAVAAPEALSRLTLPFVCALMAAGFSRRALLQLQQLESTRSEPDELMVTLFDLSLGVSTLGLLAVAAAALP
jgi:hypothetical protein